MYSNPEPAKALKSVEDAADDPMFEAAMDVVSMFMHAVVNTVYLQKVLIMKKRLEENIDKVFADEKLMESIRNNWSRNDKQTITFDGDDNVSMYPKKRIYLLLLE